MKKLMTLLIVLMSVAPLLCAQTSSSAITGNITVAAAANIASLAEPLKAAFLAKYPQAGLDFVFGASGSLTTQIQNGAPYQVFLSADTAFPQQLFLSGDAVAKPRVYASGKLILLSTTPRDFSKGLAILKDPAIVQFAMANPEIAPYGKAAQEALIKSGLWEVLQPKVVIAQSIGQALQFTLASTTIGLVNKSVLYAKSAAAYNKEGVNWLEIPSDLHTAIDQAGVLLKQGANNATAKAFVDFLASPEAKAIFLRFGYAVPKD